MTQPLFSVIIPTYERAGVLRRAVVSVLTQTVRDLELIVVDDGSTDETQAVLDSIEDSRMLRITQDNKGVSSARNTGITTARGRLVTFLDSDDEALPGWLEAMATPFDDPSCGLVCCGVRLIDPLRETNRVRHPVAPAAGGSRVLFLPGTFAVRLSILTEIGGYLDGLEYSENTELGMRLVTRLERDSWSVAALDDVLVVMHREESGAAVPQRAASILRIVDEHEDLFRPDPTRLAKWLAIAGVDLARAGQRHDARRLFARAWRAEPLRLRHLGRLLATMVRPLAERTWGDRRRS